MSTAEACATMTPNSVDFIDENDAGGVLLALLKQIAYPACTNADEHLYKIRAGDGEERNIGLAGYCSCQQSFAGSRRSDEQDTLWNASTKLLEFLRLAQEFDDFFQFFLRLIHASDIFECHLLLLHGEQAGTAPTERKRLIAASLHLADHHEPQCCEQNERKQGQ